MDLAQEFKRIATENIKRSGINDLLKWLEDTDFYTAPASTKYHGAFEGGLVNHSLNVYSQLKKLVAFYEVEVSAESIAIVSLFHDLCKVGFYKPDLRWRKDVNNQWEQYMTWKVDEDFAFGGHGSKSVFIVQSFMQLTLEEASAINCHMGAWDMSTYSNPSIVYERNTLAWLLHVADEASSYVIESRKEQK